MTGEGEDQDQPPGRVPGRQPVGPPRPAAQVGNAGISLSAALEPGDLRLDPGARGTFTIRVRNTGPVVDEIRLEILGDAAAWGTILPPSLRLYPGSEGEAVISLQPPRAPYPKAGPMELRVSIRSKERPTASIEQSGRLEISPFDELAATLDPRFGSAKREFTTAIRLDSQGNRPIEVAVGASDPHNALDLTATPQQLTIQPDSQAISWLRVRPRRTIWFGSSRMHPFDVVVNLPKSTPRALDGRLEQVPLFSRWAALLAALVVAVTVIAGGACGTGLIACAPGGGIGPGATPTPTPVIVPPPTAPPGSIPGTTVAPPVTIPPTLSNLRVVPSVAGMELLAATETLWDAGFRTSQVPEPGSGLDTFTVIRTDPPGGASAPIGSRVTIFFAFGQ